MHNSSAFKRDSSRAVSDDQHLSCAHILLRPSLQITSSKRGGAIETFLYVREVSKSKIR